MEHGVQDIFVEEFDGIPGAGRPGDEICMFLVALDHPVDVVLEHFLWVATVPITTH